MLFSGQGDSLGVDKDSSDVEDFSSDVEEDISDVMSCELRCQEL